MEKIPRGVNNEVQLTDAMALMLLEHPMYALKFDGLRHDIGNKLDFIKTNLLFGLQRPDMVEELTRWVKDLASRLHTEALLAE